METNAVDCCAVNQTTFLAMDDRHTNGVPQQLHYLLEQFSAHNSTFDSLTKPDLFFPPGSRSSTILDHRAAPSARSERAVGTPSTTPYPRSASSIMGIKGTDDYLTARAANPRTGLISPSVVTNLTPRTPLSPAEALSLYGDGYACAPAAPPKIQSPERTSSPASRPRPAGPRGRWRQNSKGWIMETATEVASPRVNTANSSASRSDFNASEDRFIVPMPSAKDPQPYRQTDQTKAVQYYKDKAQHLSQKERNNGLNGRMHSIGAGPRKFAEATKALRNCSNPYKEELSPEQAQATSGSERPSSVARDTTSPTPLTTFPPFSGISFSNKSVESVDLVLKEMPGGFSNPKASTSLSNSEHNNPLRIGRRPGGYSTPELERRDSGAGANTWNLAREKEVHVGQSPTIGELGRVRSDSNNTRFQDLRQLPRLRIVHPDGSSAKEQHSSLDKGVTKSSEATATPPPPYSSHSVGSGSPAARGVSVAESLSPLETQVVGVLAWAITKLFCRPSATCDQSSASHDIGILQSIHMLSDAETKPMERWQAIKALAVAGFRSVLILGCIVVVVRIGTAVGRLLEILFWPISVVLVVVKWMVGMG